jgi:hypothetical protein
MVHGTFKSARQNTGTVTLVSMDFYDPFVNKIVSSFGDDTDEDALADLRAQFPNYPEVRRTLREGLERALSDPDFDRQKLVSQYANRRSDTDEQARAWLMKIRDALFPI